MLNININKKKNEEKGKISMILIIFFKDQAIEKKIREKETLWRRAHKICREVLKREYRSTSRVVFAGFHERLLIMPNEWSKWIKWKKKKKDQRMAEQSKRSLSSFWSNKSARRKTKATFPPFYPEEKNFFSDVHQMRKWGRSSWFAPHGDWRLSSFDLMSSIPTLS